VALHHCKFMVVWGCKNMVFFCCHFVDLRSRENRAHYLSNLMVKILCEQSANVISDAGEKVEALTMLMKPATSLYKPDVIVHAN
jgi:hypothetical protein